jgi:hypothetical protein
MSVTAHFFSNSHLLDNQRFKQNRLHHLPQAIFAIGLNSNCLQVTQVGIMQGYGSHCPTGYKVTIYLMA